MQKLQSQYSTSYTYMQFSALMSFKMKTQAGKVIANIKTKAIIKTQEVNYILLMNAGFSWFGISTKGQTNHRNIKMFINNGRRFNI